MSTVSDSENNVKESSENKTSIKRKCFDNVQRFTIFQFVTQGHKTEHDRHNIPGARDTTNRIVSTTPTKRARTPATEISPKKKAKID